MKLLTTISLVLALASCESEYAKRCRANGGVIHQVNCSTVMVPHFDEKGVLTHFTPITTCDEQCVGAGLEAKEEK